ncbi:MAG: hypothetical protein A3G74_04360, partial [Sulfurimonas sp. RIFCSPLOWO2_12_FULL_34_6]
MRIFLCLILFSTLAFGEHVRWQSEYDKTLIEAKKENKELLLLIIKKECEKCKSVFVDIFNKEEIQEKINQKYLAVVVFFENQNSYPVELFYTQQFPALFFVSKKDESFLQTPLFGSFTT